ncbi:MAG: AraC family transcriptional regulator [Halopseudomonas sp.]
MLNPWQEGTVIGGWAIAIARALDHYQLDSQALFKQCGMNLTQALDTNSRFPVTKISQLLRLAVKNSGDENFGLLVATYIRPTSWHALGIAIWASNCMHEAFERLIRYRRLFHTALEIEMTQQDSQTLVSMYFPDAYQPLFCDTDMDAIMATTVLTCRHLADGNLKPVKIQFCRPEPANPQGFERLFHCPVVFGAADNQIIIDNDDLIAPLPTANAELAMLNDKLTQEYLSRLDRHDIVNRVYLKLIETLGHQLPDQAQLASALGLSQRSLQRKLQLAGTSYQELLDQLREQLACQYLRQSHLSINEISYLLGFSKVGSFTRAFGRWTGSAPSRYRKMLPANLTGDTDKEKDY